VRCTLCKHPFACVALSRITTTIFVLWSHKKTMSEKIKLRFAKGKRQALLLYAFGWQIQRFVEGYWPEGSSCKPMEQSSTIRNLTISAGFNAAASSCTFSTSPCQHPIAAPVPRHASTCKLSFCSKPFTFDTWCYAQMLHRTSDASTCTLSFNLFQAILVWYVELCTRYRQRPLNGRSTVNKSTTSI